MKSPLTNFDIGANYWEIDPQLKVIEPFATLYKEDKSKKKSNSSLTMWAIALFADPESRFKNLSEDKKKELIEKDYIRHKCKDFDWKSLAEGIEVYRSLYITQAQRSLIDWENKLKEMDDFLKYITNDLAKGETNDKVYRETY